MVFGFVRLHSSGPEIPRDQVGRRLDLPDFAGHHDGAGQLDNGLCQCKEPAGYDYKTHNALQKQLNFRKVTCKI